jgi:sigma-B regulation protein RsbU (phosphoserine phosphatase)
LIADVAGHGASAAMLTSLVKSSFHCSRVDAFDPISVVKRLSEDISAFGADQFVTVLCAKLLPETNELIYVNAGHSGGLVIGPKQEVRTIDVSCPLVSSALPSTTPRAESIHWDPKYSLLLYTDGVTEAWNSVGMFGDERLLETVRKAAEEGSSISEAVVSAVQTHIGTTTQTDDVTVLSLEHKQG